ncbi:hypothetical protein ACFXK6_000768 [Citrobacter koseri]|uniref:hypothetical protein n=1 Tax=Citrobacter TaxID=544 RepID=UPI001883DC88|nr:MULTISPECIES: hypothetical protein [Citrobacter]ELJ2664907.1 hypothetical protein [Citrobacter koseri]MBE9968544.1 hypothetical protein [Citrobacter freundii]MBE9975546.1 hypothetical protein [Citrobacter freundii]MBE9985133.1 hypothetical protein [Citrobacter freundii]MBF0064501.1 hypothetical protein [Citrobacter freundii]
MKRFILGIFAVVLPTLQANAVQLTQADCNYAIEKLKSFNADANANPGKRTTFEEKATYAYAEACESAGLVTIYGYLREAPEASPEVTKFCQQNAKTSGEAERCLATGKLDD